MTFQVTMEGYLTLSVTDCKKLGYFREGALCKGVVKWTRKDGTKTAEIGFSTDTRNAVPFARFVYTYNGTPKEYTVTLRWKPSNLNPKQGYYYFVCPVTGLSCRKLYLVEGRFVSRRAFSAMYTTQTRNRTERSPLLRTLDYLTQAEEMENQRYRKPYYRGNLTPYGRKLERLYKQIRVGGMEALR